ncbi:cation transporter [Aquibaculum arenosum]|uniref:Cation transporter n=1 Tax=Aquibaculum arenosum TaxID=3032591 RepID=A0ABT5YKW5_9PROT|nr:cation transporter [Fodinicurvata sp. CAU 1616]MDF2095542.1 cation transporter [Fodinicurvata sp. CAU 1616]
MSASCHSHAPQFEGLSLAYRRILWLVIAINASMFLAEMIAGQLAGSRALQADALDFAGDSLTYAITLAVIGRSLLVRSGAALLKGVSLLLLGLWVSGSTLWSVWHGGLPEAHVMGLFGLLALTANLVSVLLLMRWRDGDANIRSVWLCSRNDAIGNVAVLLAALGVFGMGTAWPDLLVAGLMSMLFLSSAWQILRRALAERRAALASEKT